MSYCIGFESALEYWLKSDVGDVTNIIETSLENSLEDFVERRQMSLPIHLMVAKDSLRQKRNGIRYHVTPKNLPKGSFLKIIKGIYISSPELCFLQAAKRMTIPELVVLACDLCAIYVTSNEATFGQVSRNPITSAKKIEKYLSSINNIDGIQNARRAIKYALDRSNSPMESKIAAISQLPFSLGGFALPKPKLNYAVKLSLDGKKLLGRDSCCCDMVWLDQKVVVEYDSTLSHLNEEQFLYDKKRTTAIELSGFIVIHLTKEHFKNMQAIIDVFMMIRKALKIETKKDRFLKFKEKRKEAMRAIFFPNWDYYY